jgi:hypothetical protein
MKAGSLVPAPLSISPLLLVLIGLSLLVWSVPSVLRGQHRPSAAAPAGIPTGRGSADLGKRVTDLQGQLEELTRARDGLKDRLDSISRDAAISQWLLAMVLSIAGLLTLAQGVFAYFSAQNYIRQADEAISRANEAVTKAETAVKEATKKAGKAVAGIDTLAADVRTRYPMFADIESARTEAFNQLSSLTPALDDDQNLYSQSDPLMRQRIYSIESFSAIQFLTPANRSTELLGNLRLLGKFYAGKFAADRSKSDFERSQYYFELALEKFGRPFSVLNDIGWLFSTVANPTDLNQARSALEESLRRRPDQQRALFDLGTIDFDRADGAKLDMARQRLLRAAEQPNWEDTPNPAMASHINYNLACVYDAIAGLQPETTEAQELLNQSMTYFESASNDGFQTKAVVEGDLSDNGDLRNLAHNSVNAERLRAARSKYELKWQRLH